MLPHKFRHYVLSDLKMDILFHYLLCLLSLQQNTKLSNQKNLLGLFQIFLIQSKLQSFVPYFFLLLFLQDKNTHVIPLEEPLITLI